MRRQKLPFLSVYFFSCWIIVGKILSLSLVWACARTSKTGPQWIEPRSVSLLPAEKTVQVGEQFQLAASVKMGESVPMLAGKSVELEVFWFDGTSLQPIPSTQLKFISKDSSLISVSGTTTSTKNRNRSNSAAVFLFHSPNRIPKIIKLRT